LREVVANVEKTMRGADKAAARASGTSGARAAAKKAEAKAAQAASKAVPTFERLARHFGESDGALTQTSYRDYFRRLLNDATRADAKVDLKRAVALYGAVPDERQLLGAFLLLFAQPGSADRFARADAERALRDEARLLREADCARLKALLKQAADALRAFHGANQTPNMVGASKDKREGCQGAKAFLEAYLSRTHRAQAGQQRAYGAGWVIEQVDALGDSKLLAADPMALTRLGVVARCFPSADLEAIRQTAVQCNGELLARLAKECEAAPDAAAAKLALFHTELAASALKRGDAQACAALQSTVKALLETTLDPAPPLDAAAGPAERSVEAAMELGLVPAVRDCQKNEAQLRRDLAALLEQKNREGFEAKVRVLMEQNPHFDPTSHLVVGNYLVHGAGERTKLTEPYEGFLWRFLTTSESPAEAPPRPPSQPQPGTSAAAKVANLYALLPFFMPFLLQGGMVFFDNDVLTELNLFLFENVELLASWNLPLLLRSGRAFFKTLTGEDEEAIARLAESKEEQWHLLNCLRRPAQCKAHLAGWSLARVALSLVVLYGVYVNMHPLASLNTLDLLAKWTLGVRPLQAAASAMARASAAVLKRASASLQGGVVDQAKRRRVEAAAAPPPLPEGRKRGPEVEVDEGAGDDRRHKRPRTEEAPPPPRAHGLVGLVAGEGAPQASSHAEKSAPPSHPVAQAASGLFDRLKALRTYFSRRSVAA